MSGQRRHETMITARRTMTERLRGSELGEQMTALPAGELALVRRPERPPSSWPDFYAAARARWTTPLV